MEAIKESSTVDMIPLDVGAHPQDDGTVLVILKTPLDVSGKKVSEVKILRGLTASEEDRAGGQAVLAMMLNKNYSKVIPNITEPMVTETVFMRMSSRDRLSLMQGVLHFFE
jgi:hypothetical protein